MEINDIPWLSAIGVLLLVPLLLAFDVNQLLPVLTDALFLIVLGLELSEIRNASPKERLSGWLHAGWMGVTWGVYQLMGLLDMGLGPINFVLSLVMIGLAFQYFSRQEIISLPDLGEISIRSTPLLILTAFMFINLIGNTSLVTGAIFLTAAGHLIKDENQYAGYLSPLGALLVGYAVIL